MGLTVGVVGANAFGRCCGGGGGGGGFCRWFISLTPNVVERDETDPVVPLVRLVLARECSTATELMLRGDWVRRLLGIATALPVTAARPASPSLPSSRYR